MRGWPVSYTASFLKPLRSPLVVSFAAPVLRPRLHTLKCTRLKCSAASSVMFCKKETGRIRQLGEVKSQEIEGTDIPPTHCALSVDRGGPVLRQHCGKQLSRPLLQQCPQMCVWRGTPPRPSPCALGPDLSDASQEPLGQCQVRGTHGTHLSQ